LLVALAFHLFGAYSGAAEIAIVALQVLFGALTIPVLMALASRLLGARAGNIAGVFCAASPTLIWLPIVFWETTLSSLFITGALALAQHCSDHPQRSLWIWLGLLCGLAMLVNPALMVVLLAGVAWAAWRARRSPPWLPALTLAAWLVVFIAWPIRNEMALNAFIPLRSNLGYELWQGNRVGSNGDFSANLHPNVNAEERDRYAQLGEVAYIREKSTLAKAAIEANPGRFIHLSLLRVERFWTGIAPANRSSLLAFDISLTSILAAAGLFFLRKKSCFESLLMAAPFVLYPLPYYFTHADFRFRLVLEPLALMLSVYAVRRLAGRHTPAIKRF
jgi:4-amino-4-deoxy-L-arabinose transferase-like glycosyltransferase